MCEWVKACVMQICADSASFSLSPLFFLPHLSHPSYTIPIPSPLSSLIHHPHTLTSLIPHTSPPIPFSHLLLFLFQPPPNLICMLPILLLSAKHTNKQTRDNSCFPPSLLPLSPPSSPLPFPPSSPLPSPPSSPPLPPSPLPQLLEASLLLYAKGLGLFVLILLGHIYIVPGRATQLHVGVEMLLICSGSD